MTQKLIWLALAGGAGTLARYGLVGFVQKMNNASFPWGTLVVNFLGCFVAGLLWTLFETRLPVSHEVKILVLVGFMGAFTTFSAFILETGQLAKSLDMTYAVANILLQNVLGLLALIAGIGLGRAV